MEELTTQLSSEVHRLDLRIDDAETSIASLGTAIEELNNDEINDSINALANIIDSHSDRLKTLESYAAVTRQEVQEQRLTKSNTRSASASDEDNQDLHDEIHEVAQNLDAFDASASASINALQLASGSNQDDIDELYAIAAQLASDMTDMDIEHHEELHLLAQKIDGIDASFGSRLTAHELAIDINRGDIINLTSVIENLSETVEAADSSLHDEIHEVATIVDRIDASFGSRLTAHEQAINTNRGDILNLTSVIDNLSGMVEAVDSSLHEEIHEVATIVDRIDASVANMVNHIALSEEEYDNLPYVDPSTFYYTYED